MVLGSQSHAPRLRLALVAVGALASLGALVVARPQLPSHFWLHGDDLALGVAWLVAIIASGWLFLATSACLLAVGVSRPHLARRLAPALPRGLRHLVEVAIVTSCVTSCIAIPTLPASAAPRAPAAAVVLADQPVVRAPEASAPVERAAPAAPAAPAHTDPTVPTTRVVVRAGDNLWSIARTALRTSANGPADPQVAQYWYAVIAANRATLRSGDPSLIYPGEIVTLPPHRGVS
jgi:hypothetical protein